jgi:tetratricopeptide (TPR) repeat protein
MRLSLQKLKKVEPHSVDDQLKIHSQYYNNYFALCIRTGNFSEGLQLLKRHLKEVKSLDQKLFQRSRFYFQYFYIYFGSGNYSQSLIHLNEWLNLPKSVEQQDLQHLARLLNLIVHFEIGNTILLSSLIRSTQRSLQKQDRWNAFEQVLLQSLRQAIQLPSFREQQTLFQQSLKKFLAIKLSPADHALLRFFDFKSWWQSKAERRDFASVMQENAKRKTAN